MKSLMQKKSLVILVCIILLAAILRLWQLGTVPLSPDWDEAALGYNAYSIMQTGKDEYGEQLPFVLKSFGDYKPGFYSYLAIPSISILGLNTFAVRLPSAILGIVTILATYFLVKELFTNRGATRNEKKDYAEILALVAAFLLAISPWHIQFSRVAFETNVGLAFNIFGALFFLHGLRKPWLLIPSALFFGLNFSVYQSERVFTPLLGISLLLLYRKQFFSLQRKYLITAFIVGFMALMPFLHFVLTNSDAFSRAKGVSIFSQETELITDQKEKLLVDTEQNDVIGTIIHNRRIAYAKEVIDAYTSHFNLNWLFITGDIPRHHAPNMGLLYLWELPFLLIGIYVLFFGNYRKDTKLLIFGWCLLAVVPAAVTRDVPHAVRTLNLLPTFQIFIALGIVTTWLVITDMKLFKGKFFYGKFLVAALVIVFAGFNFLYYLNQYFVQQNYFYAKDWQYGYEELQSAVKEIEGSVDKIVVSNVTPLDQSYIFFLFYQKINPVVYQNNVQYNGKDYERKFGKYEFRAIDWEKDKNLKNTLFIGSKTDFSGEAHPIKTITYPDGSVAIELVKN